MDGRSGFQAPATAQLSSKPGSSLGRPHVSLADVDGPQKLALLQPVLGVLKARAQTWEDCVVWARGHWQLRFHSSIIQLLKSFPPDKVGDWSWEVEGSDGLD